MMEDYTPDFYRYYCYRAKKLAKVARICRQLLQKLPSAESARQYLVQRNISEHTQELFGCGYFPSDEELSSLEEHLPLEDLNFLGLVYPYHVQQDSHRAYLNRGVLGNHNLIFPYYDIYGKMVGLMGRTLLSESDRTKQGLQKYKYTTFNKSMHLFGADLAKATIEEHNRVVLVEGQIDAISCRQSGWSYTVGLGGTTLSRYQFMMLRRYTDRFYLLLDNDKAGQSAQERIIRKYGKFASFEKIQLPSGVKDIDEYLTEGYHLKDLLIPI